MSQSWLPGVAILTLGCTIVHLSLWEPGLQLQSQPHASDFSHASCCSAIPTLLILVINPTVLSAGTGNLHVPSATIATINGK